MSARIGRRCFSSRVVISVPSNRIVPVVGLYSLTSVRPSVVLPEPDSETESETIAVEESVAAEGLTADPVAEADVAAQAEEPLQDEAKTVEELAVSPVEADVVEDWKEEEPDIDQVLTPNQKKKKRRKKRSVVFDDERGVFITSHMHKRDEDQDDWDEDF